MNQMSKSTASTHISEGGIRFRGRGRPGAGLGPDGTPAAVEAWRKTALVLPIG